MHMNNNKKIKFVSPNEKFYIFTCLSNFKSKYLFLDQYTQKTYMCLLMSSNVFFQKRYCLMLVMAKVPLCHKPELQKMASH